MLIWEQNVKKSQKYLYGWTLYFDKTLQSKEMMQRRLNKNQELHWGNLFEENFGPLKALSLARAFIFSRA